MSAQEIPTEGIPTEGIPTEEVSAEKTSTGETPTPKIIVKSLHAYPMEPVAPIMPPCFWEDNIKPIKPEQFLNGEAPIALGTRLTDPALYPPESLPKEFRPAQHCSALSALHDLRVGSHPFHV